MSLLRMLLYERRQGDLVVKVVLPTKDEQRCFRRWSLAVFQVQPDNRGGRSLAHMATRLFEQGDGGHVGRAGDSVQQKIRVMSIVWGDVQCAIKAAACIKILMEVNGR